MTINKMALRWYKQRGSVDPQLNELLRKIEGDRVSGSDLQKDVVLSQGIIDMTFTPEELKMGKVTLIKYDPSKEERRIIATLHYDGMFSDAEGFARKSGIDYNHLEYEEPRETNISDKYLALHLLPHFRQRAKMRGMDLTEYVEFLKAGGFERDRAWLRYPYEIHYSVGGHELSGSLYPSPILSYSEIRIVRQHLSEVIEEKIRTDDLKIDIKSCGCGHGGQETYGYGILAYDTLRNIGMRHIQSTEPNLNGDALEREVDKWCDRWDINVTGYSISANNLEAAESPLELDFDPRELDGEGANLFRRYASFIKKIPKEKSDILFDLCYYNVDDRVRKHVRFEWMDLLDQEQTQRLYDSPADLLILVKTFHIYNGLNKWLTSPIKEALGSIIGSIQPNGLFITDRRVDTALHTSIGHYINLGHELPPTLYFTWPGLREIPDDTEMEKCLPTSPDDPLMRNSEFYRKDETGRLLLEIYGDEIRAHKGCLPSGIYVKEK